MSDDTVRYGMSDKLCRLSSWVDQANDQRDPEALTWARLAKCGEESGEVLSAYLGATGGNPRKGVTHDLLDVEKELYDVACSALGAICHLHDNNWDVVSGLDTFIKGLIFRASKSGLGLS
jgi:hypothetical protein